MPPPPVIDCHAHVPRNWLSHDGFRLRGVAARCARFGVECVVVSVDSEAGSAEFDPATVRRVFAAQGARCAFTFGFAPPVAAGALPGLEDRLRSALQQARELAAAGSLVGIGEVGLDRYWPREHLAGHASAEGEAAPPGPEDARPDPATGCLLEDIYLAQARVFRQWIDLAIELDLPLVVHEREAHAPARAILCESGIAPERVMFHCFGSTPQDAVEAIREGFWVSLPSSIVQRENYREVGRVADLRRVLIETDSPYHSPVVGLWKRAYVETQASGATSGLTGKALEEHVAAERQRRFAQTLERHFPGLEFAIWRDGGEQHLPAAVHFRNGKARFENEPVFVLLAAVALAELTGGEETAVARTLAGNARAFYRLAAGPRAA